MRLNLSICLIAAATMLGAGCASTRPMHYYTIGLPPGRPNADNGNGPTLVVGMIATPEELQDGRIRYRRGANEVGAYEYHRWTERPGMMVHDLLMRGLRSSGKYRRVLEASSATVGDYLLRGKLYEFDEVDQGGIETKISLHVQLVETKTNRDVWDHLAERTEPVSGKSVDDVVASMDRNARAVAGEVMAGVEQFLGSQR